MIYAEKQVIVVKLKDETLYFADASSACISLLDGHLKICKADGTQVAEFVEYVGVFVS